ncbi:hypothetical protein [Microscilla marina]|uniref:Uncharacterized protein n=1 Tax=Microscilla marina ATCC 23134 TaxID=313606 RepID=A1ZSW0_MICM2|nr:hypothetical protein [Microscilla marina]EAY26524.1 hypothetical protein M23134_01694 [Microscilla marina ATCC 23134]
MEHQHTSANTKLKKDTTLLNDENDFFEEGTNFEETVFEPGTGFQKEPQLFFKKPQGDPKPFLIDVDGDQIPELEVAFSRIDPQKMKVQVKYLPTGESKELVFKHTNEFIVHHQDPSDGKTPYKFYLWVPDYTKVFYANDKQWHTPTEDEIKAEEAWQRIKPGTDHLKPQPQLKIIPEDYLSIQFQENTGIYSYKIEHKTHHGLQASQILIPSIHEFNKFGNKTTEGTPPSRGIVRDTTDKRKNVEQTKDRSVSSYTIPIEVGKIGAAGTKADHNKHHYIMTIQKSPEDNGMAAVSMSGWAGTRLVPIPGKFTEVKRAVVTENANHLELLFKGKKYNTTLRIYQQYLMLSEKNSKGTKDEIFSLNVYVDPLPENHWDVSSDSQGYFGQKLITYKIQQINGKYLPYHNKNDQYTDEGEFHQHATKDARKKIEDQPSSSSKEEELLNIRLRETQLIGAALKGKVFKDVKNREISGDQIFMDYLDLVIAVHRMSSLMKKTGEPQDMVTLAMLKDAQNKAYRFWRTFGGFVLVGVNLPNYSKQSCHHSGAPKKEQLIFNVQRMPDYIGNRDWVRVNAVLKSFHAMLESKVLIHKRNEIRELYDKKAEADAERKARIKGTKVSSADVANAREKYEREEAQVTQSAEGNFNLDTRYQKFLQEEKPPGEVYRAKALFYPEYLNVGPGNKQPTSIDLPLYYFQKNGYWHIVSLVNKEAGKLFKATEYAVQDGETHPPDEMFATLDRDDHLPKGLLYYETHDGHSSQIAITSHTPWWKYMGYIALAIFLLGLIVATGGTAGIATASLAGELFFAAGVIGAAGAIGSMVDEYQRGSTTVKSFAVNLLDIVGAFIGAVKMLRGASMIKAANRAKAGVNPGFLSKIGIKQLGGRYRYLMLEKIDLGVDATMVLIGTTDGFAQIVSILEGPGTLSEKMTDVAAILPFIAMQGGIFVGTVRGRLKTIDDVQKGKIIEGLNLKSAKKTNGSDVKSVQDLDPNEFPAMTKLKTGESIFSKETIEHVMGLVRRPQDFEPIARAVEKMDQSRLKALCARFSEKNVLYALYYFDGDFYKAHRHLLKNKSLFNDQGYNVYMNMKVYEDLNGQMKGATLRQRRAMATKTMRAKTKYTRLKNAHKKAVKDQSNESKHWTEAQEKLAKLKAAQAETQKKLDGLPEKIKNTEKTLASNEAEAESFGKLTEAKP